MIGSTAAIKLIGECFPWSDQSIYCYPYNSHTSLLNLRVFANNAVVIPSDLLLHSSFDPADIKSDNKTSNNPIIYSLFGVPGECNFSGSKYSLSNLSFIMNNGLLNGDFLSKGGKVSKGCLPDLSESTSPHRWLWFLDASKLAANSPINLSSHHNDNHICPDFVCVSFYKLFGYPTGLGALLVRKSVSSLLQKK